MKKVSQANIVFANKVGMATLMLGTAVLASLLTLSAVIILQWNATALSAYSSTVQYPEHVPGASATPDNTSR